MTAYENDHFPDNLLQNILKKVKNCIKKNIIAQKSFKKCWVPFFKNNAT